MLTWRRSPYGYAATGKSRWTVRGPIWSKPVFWLYRDGSRYTPTGSYEDVVRFETSAEARAFAERVEAGD